MKTIILTATTLSALALSSLSQETPPAPATPQETIKKAHAAAWLGIAMNATDGKLMVSEVVPDSPAGKAGLQKGDIILRIGDTAVEGDMERVIKSVTEKQPGDAIELHWQRGEKEGATRVELAARPEPAEKDFRGEFHRSDAVKEAEEHAKKLKEEVEKKLERAASAAKDTLEDTREKLEELQKKKTELREQRKKEPLAETDRPAAFLGIAVEPADDGKVIVTSVVPESPAAKAGLQKGDFILGVGGEPVKGDAANFVRMIGSRKPGEAIDLRWQRGEKEETTRIELAKRTLDDDNRNAVEEFHRHIERSRDELERNAKNFRLDLDPDSPDKHFHLHLEGDKNNDAEWKLRLGKELPLFERKFPGAADNLKGFFKLDQKEKQQNEDAIWKRVHESVAGALKEMNLGPDVTEKVLQAVENARRDGDEKQARRAKIEAEAARLEKEMQALKDRADKLREELRKP